MGLSLVGYLSVMPDPNLVLVAVLMDVFVLAHGILL